MRLAFVAPRLYEPGTVGGAETLLYTVARDAAAAGCKVDLLTTCAKSHVTWENETPEGTFERDGMTIRRFAVNSGRNVDAFNAYNAAICRGEPLGDDGEADWLRQSVNSDTLTDFLSAHLDDYDFVLAGPYLFGLVEAVMRLAGDKALLVPCLHDEEFARVHRIAAMFEHVRGCLFNTEPERELAHRLYPKFTPSIEAVVAMGIPPFEATGDAFKKRHGLEGLDYVMYSGRREPLKGTPLLLDYVDLYRRRTGRDVRLVLTGSGPIDVPKTLEGAVLDLGFVSEEEKREAMAGAAVFCHPSVNESLSIVLIEAWLARTPALVHSNGAVLRDQCRRANGGLWFHNYPDFEEELSFLLDHPVVGRKMAENGRDYAIRMYSPEAVTRRFLAALEA